MDQCRAEVIKKYDEQLGLLLQAPAIRYRDGPPAESKELRESAGVYHFYEVAGDTRTSWYVGKGGVGGDKWNLFKRMSQHFQDSQQNTLLAKFSADEKCTPTEGKVKLASRDVHVQWLILCTAGLAGTEAARDVVLFECYCKAVLRPRYCDA